MIARRPAKPILFFWMVRVFKDLNCDSPSIPCGMQQKSNLPAASLLEGWSQTRTFNEVVAQVEIPKQWTALKSLYPWAAHF